MTEYTHPPKELVREVMQRHRAEKALPQTPEEFKRELGWEMLKSDKRPMS